VWIVSGLATRHHTARTVLIVAECEASGDRTIGFETTQEFSMSASSSESGTESLYGGSRTRRVTVRDLQLAKKRGDRWPMLTAYDFPTASAFDDAGIPVLLVGDSAANVVLGYQDTIGVTVDELLPLARAVARGAENALVIGDLPFGSYQQGPDQALDAATRFMKEAGVQAVKLEGGLPVAPSVAKLVEAGIPVMGHVGFTPQSVNALGGYRVQGRGDDAARVLGAAKAIEDAGAFAIVLEMVTADLAREITAALRIPTVGIGAGADCDAQVLVWHDMAGFGSGFTPKFVKQFGDVRGALHDAARAFGDAVVDGTFPAAEHSFE
jgi:3-methyl-2-oxobutanoate hydroxymethyltransferase